MNLLFIFSTTGIYKSRHSRVASKEMPTCFEKGQKHVLKYGKCLQRAHSTCCIIMRRRAELEDTTPWNLQGNQVTDFARGSKDEGAFFESNYYLLFSHNRNLIKSVWALNRCRYLCNSASSRGAYVEHTLKSKIQTKSRHDLKDTCPYHMLRFS